MRINVLVCVRACLYVCVRAGRMRAPFFLCLSVCLAVYVQRHFSHGNCA